MTKGKFIAILLIIGVTTSTIFEHKRYDWVSFFERDPTTWSVLNAIFIILTLIAFFASFGETLFENWDDKLRFR